MNPTQTQTEHGGSGNTLVAYIQKQQVAELDGLLRYFPATPESFFYGDKVTIERLAADKIIADEAVKGSDPTFITEKEIEEIEILAGKYHLAVPFSLDFGVNNRIIGVSPTEPLNKSAILFSRLNSRLLVLLNRTKRGMIRQAAEIFQYGKIFFSSRDKGLSDVDFGFSSQMFNDLTSGKEWVKADGTVNEAADPISDLRQKMDLIFSKSGISNCEVVLDGTAWRGFIGSPKVQTFADKNKINLADISPEENTIGGGLSRMGSYFLDDKKVVFYLYSGEYKDKEGKAKKYFDDGRVVVKPVENAFYRTFFAGIPTKSAIPPELAELVPNGNLTIYGDTKAVDVHFTTKEYNETVHLELTSRPLLAAIASDTHASFVAKPKPAGTK